MEIKRVYVGGWFQRTRLHLGEMYDLSRDEESPLDLEPRKLAEFHNAMRIQRVALNVDVLVYVYM